VAKRWGQTLAALTTTLGSLALASEACTSSPADVQPGAEAGDTGDGNVDAGDPGDGDAQTTPFTNAAMRAAADAFNLKYCAAFATCDPVLFQLTFGTMPTCMGAGGLVAIAPGDVRFVNELTAPYGFGSQLTPDALRTCAAALDLSTCEAWVRFASERIVPEACQSAFYGTLADDSPCGVWNQCKSGRCLPASNAPQGACGLCVHQAAIGEPCQLDACAAGSTCRVTAPATMNCIAYADIGHDCLANAPGRLTVSSTALPCHNELVCVAGKCKAAAAPCDPGVGCPFVPQLQYCNPDAGTCEPLPLANADAPCGYVSGAPLGFVTCAYGTTCTFGPAGTDPGADAASSPPFFCAPFIEDGKACTSTPNYDNHCKRADSRCFREICQQNGPAECTRPAVLP
jgi:hypothetical protein